MKSESFPGLQLQEDPAVFLAIIPGRWLLQKTTPSWRIKDPEKGFQRMVNQKRAAKIAAGVLDQGRTFPNAIVLATDGKNLNISKGSLVVPSKTRFLVVDGQHRLWAQRFSEFEAHYACLVHIGLSEPEMATLFLEINDNQKRVPSSLRWDLVRLVQPDTDPEATRAVDLIYELNDDKKSALFQRVDLTGEQPEIRLKQGSLAPEIKKLVSGNPLRDEGYELQLEVFKSFFAALKEVDTDAWINSTSTLYEARVLRALLQLMPAMLNDMDTKLMDITAADFFEYLENIDLDELSKDKIQAAQGNAGIAAIRETIRPMLFIK